LVGGQGGEPVDEASARQLWQDDPFQFQYWAVSPAPASPDEKKGRALTLA